MRIIGGILKGRRILPPHFSARPTTDFAKEGLFNVLENQYDLSEMQVLDLFAGTGSIGLEFVSRGCKDVTCVEMSPTHAAYIKTLARDLHVEPTLRVVRHNVFDFIPLCQQQYDLIFADPPYGLQQLEGIPAKIREAGLLRSGGCFVLEHPGIYHFASEQGFCKERKYGNVHFSFFEA
jgi:N6-adenine-specific methylase